MTNWIKDGSEFHSGELWERLVHGGRRLQWQNKQATEGEEVAVGLDSAVESSAKLNLRYFRLLRSRLQSHACYWFIETFERSTTILRYSASSQELFLCHPIDWLIPRQSMELVMRGGFAKGEEAWSSHAVNDSINQKSIRKLFFLSHKSRENLQKINLGVISRILRPPADGSLQTNSWLLQLSLIHELPKVIRFAFRWNFSVGW